MAEPHASAASPQARPDSTRLDPDQRSDRLDSWKEIAAYLKRDVTTVQRWEKREGMPVHRHLHSRQGSVYAFRAELDAWAISRNIGSEFEEEPAPAPKESIPSVHNGNGRYPAAGLDSEAESSAPVFKKRAGQHFSRQHGRILLSLTTLGVAVLVVAALLYYRSHKVQQLTEKDIIVVADFDNKTGDTVFDGTLKTALVVTLDQSPFLRLLSDDRVEETLKLMNRPADSRLTADFVRELCIRAGGTAYVTGSIVSLGSEYVVGLKAVNCSTGATLAQEQVTANRKENVLNTVGNAATKLRARLGESLPSVRKFDVPLEQATTPSLEALEAYTTGTKLTRAKGASAAVDYFERAIQLDPDFAMAYRAKAESYVDSAQLDRANEYYTKAFKLRERASEREKLLTTADYYFNVTGELEKAAQAYQQIIDSFPRSYLGYDGLSMVYASMGQHENALQLTPQVEQLMPDEIREHEFVANVNMTLQRFDDARLAIRQAQARKLDDFSVHDALYGLAFLASDSPGIVAEQRWFRDHPAVSDIGFALDSDTEAYAGHIGKSRAFTKRAVDASLLADSKENGAIWWENAALREAAFGNAAAARDDAAAGLRLYPTSESVQLEVALAYAMLGDTARAQELARDLNERYPLDTRVQSIWLPAINAQIALNYRRAPEAIEQLQNALPPIEYGSIDFIPQFSCLYPTYIRGQAYLAAGKGKEAAAEFQKIVDHSGMVWNCWTGSLARLGIARANAIQTKTLPPAEARSARARGLAAYEDFLTRWKDADADVPIYKQAKTEYAKLKIIEVTVFSRN